MRFNYCLTLAMIVIILFSIGTVVASENITEEISISNNTYLDDDVNTPIVEETLSAEVDNNHDVLNHDSSQDINGVNKVDLSVRIDVKNAYQGKNYNCEGLEVPWTITVKVTGGTAHNVLVRESLSSNLEYISHNLTKGTYDSSKKVWTIGELSESGTATLTILTKLKSNGTFTNTAKIESGTFDTDSSNNQATLSIETGSEEDGSNITKTTDDQNKPKGKDHYRSTGDKGVVGRQQEGSHPDNGKSSKKDDKGSKSRKHEKSSHSKKKSESNDNSKSNSGNGHASGVARYTSSFSHVLSAPVKSLSDVLNPNHDSSSDDNLNNDSSDGNTSINNPSNDFGVIPPYDYSIIPLSVFAVFLLLLAGIVSYDKIKS